MAAQLHVEITPRDDGLDDMEIIVTNATKEEAEKFYSELMEKAGELGLSLAPGSGIYRTN